ncbi:hypothetical protein CHARACLAT_004871 [Characodon lateralis]|uniref:Uncharacterized protein n=1 Tax=Characodon lateralis TaxID=208331 RepID=A0ABU7ER03_9TELE|nr:hypothetical protein [Characodon lateralis]
MGQSVPSFSEETAWEGRVSERSWEVDRKGEKRGERVDRKSLQSVSSPLFRVLRFVIPSLLFTQRPLAHLPSNDLFLCSSVLYSCFILPPSPQSHHWLLRSARKRRRRRRDGG